MVKLVGDGATAYPYQVMGPNIVAGQRINASCWMKSPATHSTRSLFYCYGGTFEYMSNDGQWHKTYKQQEFRSFTTTSSQMLIRLAGVSSNDGYFDYLDVDYYSYDRITSKVNAKYAYQTIVADMPFFEIDEINKKPSVVGMSDRLQVQDVVSHTGTNWTIGMVFRATSTTSRPYVLTTYDYVAGATTSVLSLFQTSGKMRWYNYTDVIGFTHGTCDAGDWHSFILTSTASGTVEAWVDGVKIATMTGSTIHLGTGIMFYIGTTASDPVAWADFEVYEGTLTDDQVAQLYQYHRDNFMAGYKTPAGLPALKYWWGFHKAKNMVSDHPTSYQVSTDEWMPLGNWHDNLNALNWDGTSVGHATLRQGGLRFPSSSSSEYKTYKTTSWDFITNGDSTVGFYANMRDVTTPQIFLATNFSGNSAYTGFRYYVASGIVYATYTDGAGHSITPAGAPISAGKHSIISTFDSATKTVSLYIDGTLYSSLSDSSFDITTAASYPLQLGDYSSYYMRDWTVRNIAFYADNLSASYVAELHKRLKRSIY
jgi:hypothetical protein